MRTARLSALVLVLLAATACHRPATFHPMDRPLPQVHGQSRYDELVEIACHNCYVKGKITEFRASLDRTHNVELDIHGRTSKSSREHPNTAAGRSWYVRHDKGGPNNENNCPGAERDENDLVGCLEAVRDWIKSADTTRSVVTIFLDLKFGAWEARRTPADLDSLLVGIFGRRKLFTPGELRGTFPSVREAARARAWPSRDSLRGRVVVVLTGGETGIPFWPRNRVLAEYVRDRDQAAAAFVAPSIRSTGQVRRPNSFTPRDAESLAFYNFWGEFHGLAELGRTIRGEGGVGRLWLNNETLRTRGRYSRVQTFCNAAYAGFQRLASKRFTEDLLCPGARREGGSPAASPAGRGEAASPPPPRPAGGPGAGRPCGRPGARPPRGRG